MGSNPLRIKGTNKRSYSPESTVFDIFSGIAGPIAKPLASRSGKLVTQLHFATQHNFDQRS
jgi:hypothetical protein